MSMQGLPEKTGQFSPFFSDDVAETIWSREKDWVRFQKQMKLNVRTHTILTGPSGSGKSTFLKRVVQPKLPKRLIFNSSYFDFISTFLNMIPVPTAMAGRRSRLEKEIKDFLKTPIELSLSRVLQDTSEFPVPYSPQGDGGQGCTFRSRRP